MAGEDSLSSDKLRMLINDFEKRFIGGLFPELIFEGERKKRGVLLIPLDFKLITQTFVLGQTTDCMSSDKKPFMVSKFNNFGISVSYISTGAGTLAFEQIPCMIDNKGLHHNAAVIGWGKKKSSVDVAHARTAIINPLKVIEITDRKQLISINWNHMK